MKLLPALLLLTLLACRALEVEDSCHTFDTVQLENYECIKGNLEHCFCPSDDPSVQNQCTEHDLPDREPYKCESGDNT
jgi:hypothetical protein